MISLSYAPQKLLWLRYPLKIAWCHTIAKNVKAKLAVSQKLEGLRPAKHCFFTLQFNASTCAFRPKTGSMKGHNLSYDFMKATLRFIEIF